MPKLLGLAGAIGALWAVFLYLGLGVLVFRTDQPQATNKAETVITCVYFNAVGLNRMSTTFATFLKDYYSCPRLTRPPQQ